jgi:DNA-binding NarL/FixJ family response regulator
MVDKPEQKRKSLNYQGEVAMQLNVIICCQIYLYAEGLRRLLEEDEDIRVLGIACTDEEIKKLIEFEPDVIVSDMASCKKVLKQLPSNEDKKVLLVNDSMDLCSESLKTMITDGLGGILPKNADGKLLQKATRKLHDGELWIDHQTMREVFSRPGEPSSDIHVTKKELEILNYICSGLSNKEIAKKLFISEQTVKSHCNHLFKKFGVTSRLKLALCAPKYFPESLSQS